MAKSRAYTTEFGFEKVTAWSLMQERKKYGGRPLGKTYWSTHKPGKRKSVKHVQKGDTAFFAYINGADDINGDGGGESLTHQLFKEAIAGLSGTKLKLGNAGEYEVSITHGQVEKEIQTSDGRYYADAYWQFNSTSDLGLRWSGEVYLEVHHTHAVPPQKQEGFRQARLPVIEIDVPQILEYPIADENTTDPLEAAHVSRIKNMLQKGFLAGRVISDRRSIEYLEQEVDRLGLALHNTTQDLAEAEQKREGALARLRAAVELEARLNEKISSLIQQVNAGAIAIADLTSSLSAEKESVRKLSVSLSDAKKTIKAQSGEIRLFNYVSWGLLALMIGLGAFLLYQHFFSPNEVAPLPTAPTSQVQHVAPSAVAAKAKQAAKHVAPSE